MHVCPFARIASQHFTPTVCGLRHVIMGPACSYLTCGVRLSNILNAGAEMPLFDMLTDFYPDRFTHCGCLRISMPTEGAQDMLHAPTCPVASTIVKVFHYS